LKDDINQALNAVNQPVLLLQNSETDLGWTMLDDDFFKTILAGRELAEEVLTTSSKVPVPQC